MTPVVVDRKRGKIKGEIVGVSLEMLVYRALFIRGTHHRRNSISAGSWVAFGPAFAEQGFEEAPASMPVSPAPHLLA